MENEVKLTRQHYKKLLSSFLAEFEHTRMIDNVGEPDLALALLRDAWHATASDIHVDPELDGFNIRLRIDGILLDTMHLDCGSGKILLNQFKALAKINPGTQLTIEEGRFTHSFDENGLDMRVVSVPSIAGPKLAIRLLVQKRMEQQMHQLGLRDEQIEAIENWLERMTGMFLAAGPTGSGKTTTLYSLLHKLKNFESNIVTIEDPVEYSIKGVNQIQVDPVHELHFAEGGRALLRLDPDCLLIGEIRDASTADTALLAASRGGMLLSSIHSHDAVGVITVLRKYGMSNQDIASTLSMVVAQKLVRALCPECKRKERMHKDDRQWFAGIGFEPPAKAWYPEGCSECNNIGYRGRSGVFELWQLQEKHYAMILNDKDIYAIKKQLREEGHNTLLDEALLKLSEGIISPREMRVISGYGPVVRSEGLYLRDKKTKRSTWLQKIFG